MIFFKSYLFILYSYSNVQLHSKTFSFSYWGFYPFPSTCFCCLFATTMQLQWPHCDIHSRLVYWMQRDGDKKLRNHFYFNGLLNSLYCMEKFKSNLFPFRVKCCGECRQERVECEEDVGSSSGLLRQICVFLGSHWRKVGHWVMLYHCHCHANAIFSQDLCSACLPAGWKLLVTLVCLMERWLVPEAETLLTYLLIL